MSPSPDRSPRRWWREPMLWLVIGLPAVAVVASIGVAVVAVRGADPVLQRKPEPQQQQSTTRPDADTPALQARNHAATAAADGPADAAQ